MTAGPPALERTRWDVVVLTIAAGLLAAFQIGKIPAALPELRAELVIGFVAAGLALLTAARYQWKVGGQLRRIAPVSAVIGLAMQFIWIDAATIMHPIVGTGFFVWLLVVGAMLATGRVERHFTAMVTASATRGRSHAG